MENSNSCNERIPVDSLLPQFNWAEMMSEDVAIKVASTPKSAKLDMITNRLKIVITGLKKYDIESRRSKVMDDMNQWYSKRRHKIQFDPNNGEIIDVVSTFNQAEIDTSPGSLAVLQDMHRFGSRSDQMFFRVQIQRKIVDHSTKKSMDSYEGLLIDVGETVRFCKHELYPLESQFMPMPPQVFTIKMAGLDAWENTGRLGNVLESTLLHFGKEFLMRVKKSDTNPPEVNLIKEGLGLTLNDYIAIQCSTVGLDRIIEKTEGDKIEGCFINTILPNANITVKLGLPVQKAVTKCLEEAEELGFEGLKALHPPGESRTKGEIYVARHPETKKLERCQIVNLDFGFGAEFESEEEAIVEWIDFGGQSNIKLTELVKAEVVSPVLKVAPGTCAVFKLQNILEIRVAPERLNNLLRISTKPVTLTVTEIPLGGPPKVLVHYEGAGGQHEIFNRILIDRKVATPIENVPLNWTLPNPRILLSQLIWTMPMDLVSAEWTPLSKEDPLKTLYLEPGQRVRVDIPFEDGQFVHCLKFRIRPAVTKAKFEKLQRQLRDYCEEIPWIAKERNNKQIPMRDGECCIVEVVESEFARAKICGLQKYRGYMQVQMYELLVIDYGNVYNSLETTIIQVKNPWPMVNHLGPQIALAEWKVANDNIEYMDGSPENRLKELSKTLRDKLGNGKNVLATVTKIVKDQYGRNVVELAFEFDREVECELRMETMRIV